MTSLAELKIGQSVITETTGSVDDRYYKAPEGHQIRKGEEVVLRNSKGDESAFKVKRIMGGMFVVLVGRGKKSKLSLLDAFNLVRLGINRKF